MGDLPPWTFSTTSINNVCMSREPRQVFSLIRWCSGWAAPRRSWGGAAKAALGAAITGVTGAKVSFDKNAYFAKTLPALVASMQASRKEVLLRIRKGLELGDDKYPLTQALVDLEDYYNAGTIPGAITGITASADEASRKASEELKVVLQTTRDPDFLKRKPRVDTIVRKINGLSDGQAIVLNQTPPTRDSKSETTLKRWMNEENDS